MIPNIIFCYSTADSADPKNGRTPAPKRGVDVSMDNPNYMSNSTIRVHQEKDTKRVSVISQSHQRNENPQRVSKVDPKVSYSALDHPIVVVEEVRKSEEDDVYSLADESEHNYSCISNDPSQNSRDDREDRDSVHDYSCISNNSRLSTSSSNVSNDPNEACPIDIEPADYEDFYSIPNAGDNISESEGENETEGNKGGHEKEGEEEKQEEQSDVNNQPEPPDYPSKETSVEATDKASKIKRRSATSSDIFNVQSTQSLLAVHPSDYDSRLTRLQGIEGRSGSAAAVPGSPYKPVPKPRVLRKTAESTAK